MNELILKEIQNGPIINSRKWAENQDIPHNDNLVGSIKRLEALGYINVLIKNKFQ